MSVPDFIFGFRQMGIDFFREQITDQVIFRGF